MRNSRNLAFSRSLFVHKKEKTTTHQQEYFQPSFVLPLHLLYILQLPYNSLYSILIIFI